MKKIIISSLLAISFLNALSLETADQNQSKEQNATISKPIVIKHSIPYLNRNGDYKTFVKVFNDSECEITSKAIVYGDNGEHNDRYGAFPIFTSLKPKHSIIVFADNIQTIAQNLDIDLPDAFGMEIIYECKGDQKLKRNQIFTLVLQKSPEGQRVIPVYRNFDQKSPTGSGKMVITHIYQEEGINRGGFQAFIKILNTSNENIKIKIKGYPDYSGEEHFAYWTLPAKKATAIMGEDLYKRLKIPYNTPIAIEIDIPKNIEKLYPVAVQKTYYGPRVLKVYKFK